MKTLHLREQAELQLMNSGTMIEIYRSSHSKEMLKIFVRCVHPHHWKLLGPVLTEQMLFFKN